tara:strand:- start:3411 stop:3749 length:339 start_codon:yes stop_codon:yes gene_type:complete
MIPNILFKVISNNTERQKMTVKFCRANAPEPIENYDSCSISYRNLDFSTPDSLIDSLRSIGNSIIIEQLSNEPILEENSIIEELDSIDMNKYVGRIISISYQSEEELNEVKL